MEHTSLSDALISLIPTYGPWIIFGIVALENAGENLHFSSAGSLTRCCGTQRRTRRQPTLSRQFAP
jgi:hypothetical protein